MKKFWRKNGIPALARDLRVRVVKIVAMCGIPPVSFSQVFINFDEIFPWFLFSWEYEWFWVFVAF